MTLRKDHTKDESTTASDNAHVTNFRIDLGTQATALVLLVLAVVCLASWTIGQNTAERKHQETEQRMQADMLQREMIRQTQEIQREWSRQTAQLTEQMQNLQRQFRMTELKYDDVSVVLHREGMRLPGDYARGPQGNLDSESFKQEGKHGSRRHNPAASSPKDGR